MTIKQITDTIKEAEGLKDFSAVLTEVSTLRLRRIRKEVEGTRIFFADLSLLYGLVKALAPHLIFPKKGTVSLLLTSNFRFNGHLNDTVMRFFIDQTEKYQTDRIVIGSLAKKIFQSLKYSHPVTYLTFKTDLPTPQELINLTDKIKDYERILVYYSEFKTVLRQLPAIKDITQTAGTALQHEKIKERSFILEPELKNILQFFDTHIKVALLQQVFLEAQLSRVATRLITMDEAQRKARDFLSEQKTLLTLAKRSLENKRILEAQAYLFRTNHD